MRKAMIFFVFILFTYQISYSQIPNEFIKTWYLESFSDPQGEEIFVVDLNITQGPSLTISANLMISGNSFCNDFSGEYIYTNNDPLAIPHTFQPINVTRTFINCGSLEDYETHFFVPFMEEVQGDILVLTEDFLVIEYNPLPLYQTYRNEPVLNISEQHTSEIVVYPIPASQNIFISGVNGRIESVRVYNVSGLEVIFIESPNSSKIEVSDLDTGLYFLRITWDDRSYFGKFLKY